MLQPLSQKRLDRQTIADDYASGMSAEKVAAKHGTTPKTVVTYGSGRRKRTPRP